MYDLSVDELKTLADIAGIPVRIHKAREGSSESETPLRDGAKSANGGLACSVANDEDHDGATQEVEGSHALSREIAGIALEHPGDAFADYVATHAAQIHEAAFDDKEVAEALVFGYRLGISAGSGACMNDLGALYYMGDLVEQDYEQAAKLYELAMDHGCYQSVINLGYIYEYGRTGERDLEKAFRFYALAAALAPSSEAVYKLGDMFSRGQAGRQDMPKALALWERSLELAKGPSEVAQPAARIAGALIDEHCAEWGLERNPLRALSLFQQAEIGLRIDIANGQTYYRKRLDEAIEGQYAARRMLDE